jgi:hypothetical protein
MAVIIAFFTALILGLQTAGQMRRKADGLANKDSNHD